MPALGILHILKRWLVGLGGRSTSRGSGVDSGQPPELWLHGSGKLADGTRCEIRFNLGAPRRVPVQVIAGLTPGHLRVAIVTGGGHLEIPLDRVPFAYRMPNTPLWITVRGNEVIAVEPGDP